MLSSFLYFYMFSTETCLVDLLLCVFILASVICLIGSCSVMYMSVTPNCLVFMLLWIYVGYDYIFGSSFLISLFLRLVIRLVYVFVLISRVVLLPVNLSCDGDMFCMFVILSFCFAAICRLLAHLTILLSAYIIGDFFGLCYFNICDLLSLCACYIVGWLGIFIWHVIGYLLGLLPLVL